MFRPVSLRVFVHLAIFAALFSGCGAFKDSSSIKGRQEVRPFILNQNQFQINVRYEVGAEPYVNRLSNGLAAWSITEMNLKANLPQWISNVRVPFDLSEMTQINAFGRSQWSKEELEALAFKTQFSQDGLTNNTITVYYLNGSYVEKPKAIGLHFHGSSVVFVFKQVVRSLEGTLDSQTFTEQSAVVHEIGHAFGLVDGLSLIHI